MKAADNPQKKQMTTRPIPLIGTSLENPDGPDDRDDREYYDDRGCDGRHDPDHDLEKDPGGNDEDEDGQHPPAEVSCCFAHLLRVRVHRHYEGCAQVA